MLILLLVENGSFSTKTHWNIAKRHDIKPRKFYSVMLTYKNMKEQSTLKFSTILGVVSSKGKGLEPGRRRKEEGDQGLLAS